LILTSALHVGQRKLIFKCEGHGREECISEMDISNTIGWFTNIYPVILAIPLEIDISDKYTDYTSVITQIKEQIRKIPNKGIGYGILKYLYDSSPIKNLLDLNQINLTFNYLGQFDFDTESSGHELIESDETPGISISPENQPITLIEINCWISNARFYINIGYSARHFSNQFVEDFGNQYIQVLKNVINHCIQQRKLFHTVSDFPLVSISENELNELQNSAVVEDIYPLSPLQKEMLYHHQQVAECDAYLTQIQWFQNQKLDADAYRAAWQTVIDHIPVLRTGFLPSMQVVYKDVTLDWQHYNLEMQDPTDIEHIISDFLVSDRKNNFDLTSHSLMRITLIFLPDNRQLVIWTHHHIILDGWSIPIILNLLNDYYQKYIQCSSVKLLRYVPEFKDYIKWFGTNNQTEILSFWKNKFKNLKYPVTISGTKFNLYGNNHFIQKQSYLLSEDEYQFINKFCKKNHLTMNIFMQLAWALVIAINAKSTDVVYSLIHAGRLPEFPDCDKIIGLCANILPIRIQFSAPQTFIDVLRSIQTYLNEINDHGNINQREIFRLINPELDINITESLFIFENYPIEMQQLASLNFNIKMNYPIQVVFVPRHQSLAIELVHDKNIPDCRISKLLSDLRSIINTISQDSQVSIKQFFPALFEENFIFNYHPGYAKKKWFFIHPSGCGAESYLPLALNCPEHIALYAIDSYHLKVGVDDFNSIEQLAQFYASQILEIQSQGPFYLGGWSFGGLVALEIAQILTKNGKIVNDLVVFDSFINTNKLFHNSSFQKFSENMIMSSRYYQELSQGPQYNVLLTMRKEANMIANYYPRPYLGRVSLFKAMELPEPNNFEVMKDLLAQPQNGWETLASQLNVYHLNTHHWQIFSSQEWDLINSVLS
jgi:non-ribosomal peptide synthase protein (TIGR01720 family)